MSSASRRLVPLLLLTVACRGDGPSASVPACPPVDTTATPLALAVGEVQVLSGAASVQCVRLERASAAREYLVIAANGGTTLNRVEQLRVVTDAAAPAAAVALAPEAVRASLTAAPAGGDLHARIMAKARALPPRLAEPVRSRTTTPGIRASILPAGTPTVGTRAWVRIPKLDVRDACTSYDSVRVEVKHVSQRSIIIQDSLAPVNGFDAADFAAIGAEFDDLIFRVDTSYFGMPSDLDANQRVVIHYTRKVNEATPPPAQNPDRSLLAGFFWAGDLYPRTGTNRCVQSNEAEIFYLLLPDPTGSINQNVRTVADVRERTRGTVAHEFQHMINASIKLRTVGFEHVWLDEALAHLAEEMVGRAKKGYGDTQALRFSDVLATSTDIPDYRAFFEQNLARFELWLDNPPAAAPADTSAGAQLAPRGAAWALLRHAGDHHAPGIRALTRGLVASSQVGIPNFVGRTGVPFDQSVMRWLVASYADDLGVPGLPEAYTYTSWNMREAVTRATQGAGGTYPLQVSTIGVEATASTSPIAATGGFFLLQVPAGTPVTALRLLGPRTVPTANARLVLLRTK